MKNKFKIVFSVMYIFLNFICRLDVSAMSDIPVLTVQTEKDHSNVISWTKVSSARSYLICAESSEDMGDRETFETTENKFRHKNLKPNTKYTYKVAAKYADGKTGEFSKSASIYTYNYFGREANHKISTVQGEWIYFADGYDYDEDNLRKYRLCKVKKDGTEFTDMDPNHNLSGIIYLNVMGEDLYFYDYDTNSVTKRNIVTDEVTDLSDPFPDNPDYGFSEILYVGDTLYCITYCQQFTFGGPFTYELYTLDTTGTKLNALGGGMTYIESFGEYVYWYRGKDGWVPYNKRDAHYIGNSNNRLCFGIQDLKLTEGADYNEDINYYYTKYYNVFSVTDFPLWENKTTRAAMIKNFPRVPVPKKLLMYYISFFDKADAITASFDKTEVECDVRFDEVMGNDIYCSDGNSIKCFDLKSGREKENIPVPAEQFKITDKGIFYTVTENDNKFTSLYNYDDRGNVLNENKFASLYRYDDRGNVLLEKNNIRAIDFYDDFAFAFNAKGEYMIINYDDYDEEGIKQQKI